MKRRQDKKADQDKDFNAPIEICTVEKKIYLWTLIFGHFLLGFPSSPLDRSSHNLRNSIRYMRDHNKTHLLSYFCRAQKPKSSQRPHVQTPITSQLQLPKKDTGFVSAEIERFNTTNVHLLFFFGAPLEKNRWTLGLART